MIAGGLAAVILAAGAGRRLGGVAKALLPHRGATYLAAICATAREVGLVDAVVVVGAPFGNEVAAHARQVEAPVGEPHGRGPTVGALDAVNGRAEVDAGAPALVRLAVEV